MGGLEGADSSEFSPDAPHKVIATMAEQVAIVEGNGDLGGSMRLGSYPAELLPGSVVAKQYGRRRWPNVTGIVTRSTTPIATGWKKPVASAARHPIRGWWSSSSCRTTSTLLCRDSGPPRTEVQADQTAPAVRGLDRGALDRKLATRLPVDQGR